MTGSEKQIKWASDIRTNLLRWIEKAKSEVPAEKHAQLEAMFSRVLDQADAGWWIDNLQTVPEINTELTHKFNGSAWEIKPGQWQGELRGVVAINSKL